MSSYHNLCRLLAPLRLYSLGRGGLVDSELKAYAAGFRMLRARIEEARRAGNLQTAEGEALGLHEGAAGLPVREGEAPPSRRALVAERRRPGAGTVSDLLRQLAACGLMEPTLTEGEGGAVTVGAAGVAPGIPPERAWALAAALLPAHLAAGGPAVAWDALDSLGRIWDGWDALGKSWTLLELTGPGA